jgi:hypothetical protein
MLSPGTFAPFAGSESPVLDFRFGLAKELLDARTLCRQMVRDSSVEAFLAVHRHELFPDNTFEGPFPFKTSATVGAGRRGGFGRGPPSPLER